MKPVQIALFFAAVIAIIGVPIALVQIKPISNASTCASQFITPDRCVMFALVRSPIDSDRNSIASCNILIGSSGMKEGIRYGNECLYFSKEVNQ